MNRHIEEILVVLYGGQTGRSTAKQMEELVERYRGLLKQHLSSALDEKDALLITYGDQVRESDRPALASLSDFCGDHLAGLVSGIHILPFFPYSSDDGFSVIDYRKVNPDLGNWENLNGFHKNFKLMFDGVINHISAESAWFQGYLRSEESYQNYFIEVNGNPDLSNVVRPRALPLLTQFPTAHGPKWIWTTFSTDQIDLEYHNPAVLLEMTEILLEYVVHGADFIRLDAIAYLWKEIGTACIHLPQTHQVVQLWRAVLDEVAPGVRLITETNVPHQENLSYFGDGTNEAHLVYNFALPPLVLHAFRSGRARELSKWAQGLQLPSKQVTFFNFLASHDGIGLNPVRGILPEEDINALAEQVHRHGGFVSQKNNLDGTQSPYELNINFFDALSDPAGQEPLEVQVNRFLASQAILLSLVGLPGIYFHSLFGSRGWPEGVTQTQRFRTINRQKLKKKPLEHELAEPGTLRNLVFVGYSRLLKARAGELAFDPSGNQRVYDIHEGVFGLLRSAEKGKPVLCLVNVQSRSNQIDLPREFVGWKDLLGGAVVDDAAGFFLEGYQIAWLKEQSTHA